MLVQQQIDKAKRGGRIIDEDTAYEEVVADSCESFLRDSKLLDKLIDLAKKDMTLFERTQLYIDNLLADLRKCYKGFKPDSFEGKKTLEMTECIERLHELWEEAAISALDNSQKAGGKIQKNTTEEGGDKYSSRYEKADTNKQILVLLERVEKGNFKPNEKVDIGLVPNNAALVIQNLTGIDVSGYKMVIEARQLEHILKDHGKNGKSDKSLSNYSDIAKIDYIINNYDDLRKSGKTQAYSYMKDGRNRTADTVLYEKRIGNKSYYVVQAVADTKAKTLYVVSAFIGKNGYKKETSQLINAKSPDATANTGSVVVSTNSILNPNETVKENSVKKSDRDYSYNSLSPSDYYKNGKIYSYDFLTAQADMSMVELPKTGTLTNEKGRIDDGKVLSLGIKNALYEGTKKSDKVYVKNAYTGRELRIDNSTIKHGLNGTYNRHLTNARIGSVIGTVVKNAIPINGLKNFSQKATGTYAMACYCYDNQNREFVAIVTVEQHSGNVDSFELYDVAHAVSGRQKKSSQVDTKSQGVYPIKAATISISDFLEIVNGTHQSILSNDVLLHFGETRDPQGSYSDKVLFQDRDTEYLTAVNNNDMQTAQRLVDETAEKAGYNIKSYHGTLAKDFTEFKKEFIGTRFSFDEKGFFFIDRKSIAEDYASSEFNAGKKGRVLDVYLKVANPLNVDAKFVLREGLGNIFKSNDVIDVWDNYNSFLLEEADNRKADGIIIDDGTSKMTVVFGPEQIKSADPVTYDDNGDVIPLSERFNAEKKDIRYSGRDKNGIDKYGFEQDNVSRANKQGELLNEFYNALTKEEWKLFYDKITESGHLATTRIGTIAPIVVKDKLIIAERLRKGKDAHDYIVTDAYKLFVGDGDYYTLTLLQDALNKGDVEYDTQRIFSFVNRLNRLDGRNELLARYNRDNSRFDVTYDNGKQKNGISEIHRDSQEGIAGERLSLRDKSSVQGNDKFQVKNSLRDPEAIANYEKISKQLARENAKLTEDISNLKELLKLQRTVTHGKTFTKSSLSIVAKRLMSYMNAKGNSAELTGLLNNVYTHIAEGKDVSWESIRESVAFGYKIIFSRGDGKILCVP